MDQPYYEQIGPPAALTDTIECFWRLLMPLVVAPGEVIAAEGRAEILFQFEGQSQVLPLDSDAPFDCASSWLMRPYAHGIRARQIGVSSSAMIGARFRPGGWAAFHHEDTTDNQPYSWMPLRDFYTPHEVRLLEEELYQGLRTPEWANPLVNFLLKRKIEHVHYDRIAYATLQLQQQPISIAALPLAVNLSDRQFGRVFRQLVGLSPKQFSRIARMERLLQSSEYSLYGLTLEQLATRYGYHDAAHLVHEFQTLVGISPTEYFSGYYDLIEQKFRDHDRFLQLETDRMSMSFSL